MDASAILSSSAPVKVNEAGEVETLESEAKNIVDKDLKPESTSTPPSPTEPAKEEPKPDSQVSPRLAFLAKEEKRLQEERKKFSEERNNPEFKEFLEFKKMKENKKDDPLGVLEKLGMTYDELTDYVISGKHTKDPSVRALEEKLAKLENEAKEKESKAKKDLEEAQLNQFKSQIKEECLKNADEFELVNVWGAHNLVYNVIQEHYDKTQEILPTNEAAKKVEAYLEEESKKYSSSKKLKRLFGVPDQAAKAEDDKQADSPARMSTTLSNSATAGSTSTNDSDEIDPRVLVSKAAKLLMR